MAKGDPRLGNGGAGYFPAIYQSALAQTAEDYDKIMGEYDALGQKTSSESGQGKVNFNPISPTFANYQPGSDFSELKNFADTGGYSEGDIGNIRERAISPIRSIYANAQRELGRQKNLSGGYAPNFAAACAKMAREQSGLISGKTTDANAQIAQLVQSGKLAGATALAPLQARENELKNSMTSQNAQIANQIAELNAKYGMEADVRNKAGEDRDFDKQLETIRGKQSLFGTTPANMSTIGNQVLGAANVANNFAPITREQTPRPGGINVNPLMRPSGMNLPKLGVNNVFAR